MASSHGTQPGQPSEAPGRRAGRVNNRRAEIVGAATQLFLEKGYDATSMQDIATAVGLLKGSLFYYIDEKEDLLFAVLEGMLTSSLAEMKTLRALDVPPLVRVRRMAESHVYYILTNRDQATIFFRDFRSLSDDRSRDIAAERDNYARGFTALLREAQTAGDVCPDVDVRHASGALLGMLNMVYDWYPHADERHARKLAREVADLVVASLICDSATHQPGHRRTDGEA
jgi:AcrR family transcriptional regulator